MYSKLWQQHADQQISTQQLVAEVLAQSQHWQCDLTQIPGLVDTITEQVDAVLATGMRAALKSYC